MNSYIPGLRYHANYLSPQQEQSLLAEVYRAPWRSDFQRRVQHYGYRYDYKRHNVSREDYLGPLPPWAADLAARLRSEGLGPLDQLIVNEYRPGQGIAPHVDCEPCFGETIISLTLGSGCTMEFSHRPSRQKREIWLEPGSLLVLQGAARHDWKHSIPPRKTDLVEGQRMERATRVSLTFRSVILAAPLACAI